MMSMTESHNSEPRQGPGRLGQPRKGRRPEENNFPFFGGNLYAGRFGQSLQGPALKLA